MRHIAFIAALSLAPSAGAQILRGKVVMPDASIPAQRVYIERLCPGEGPYQEAVANKRGEYFIHNATDTLGVTQTRAANESVKRCLLRARMKGYESNAVDLHDPRVLGNPQLPLFTLRPLGGRSSDTSVLPKSAVKSWESGTKALDSERWAEAERLLLEVAAAAPQFAPAWTGVGMASQNQQRPDDARQAYQRAIALDAAALQPRLFLTRLEITARRWPEAAAAAETLIAFDANRRYPEAFLAHAIARYQLKQLDAAHTSLLEAVRFDTRGQLPQAEYFLGAVLAGKGDRAAAATHLRAYLDRAPSAPGADLVRRQLEELAAAAATPQTTLQAPAGLLASAAVEPDIAATGEAWVPGGRKALAAVAHMDRVPAPADFFLEYARTVAIQTSRLNEDPIAGYAAGLLAFVTAVAELTELGDRRADRTVLHLSLAPDARSKTGRILHALGWRVYDREGKPAIEPGDQPADGPRQQVPAALGIDELAMQSALEAGRPFEFEILSETAALAGGAAWGATLEGFATLDGGIAEAFVRQPRLAKTYAGLGAMGPADGLAFARRAGLRSLTATCFEALWLYGDALHFFGNQAVVPGGTAAEEIWAKLSGASPRDAMKFFQAILTVDRGRLAAFFAVLARADSAHQRFFTRDLATAQRYYAWYRDSEELREGIGVPERVWRPDFFRKLALDRVSPGDDTVLLNAEALLASARLRNLSPESAKLFAQNFNDWRGILPYLEALPALGPAEFQALAAFTAAAPDNTVMGNWHSLAALIVLGRKAGSLDDAAAARHFGEICRKLAPPEMLRVLIGSAPNLDHAVADFLRLDGPRRAAFLRVRELQPGPSLPGLLYAAFLDPDLLILNEDRNLLSRHVFVTPKQQPLFLPASLVAASGATGSHFLGGFAGIESIARTLPRIASPAAPSISAAAAAVAAAPEPAAGALFRADTALVEAHTTVTDARGRYVDGLTAASFTIRQDNKAVPIAAFENSAAPISCALLLDTSQSMDTAIAALKNSALKLIAALRPSDSVAVYSLNGGVSQLVAFTTDKVAATRAVLRVEIGSRTALYDGLIRVNRDLSGRPGRKVIVVFTDGEDNASTLTAGTAIVRAKVAGAPIYTIALGHAVRSRVLLKDLSATSQATGGLSFPIQTAAEIGDVFDKVLQDLLHGYLLAFSAPSSEDHGWRPIQVLLKDPHNYKVRSREGYYPQ